MNKQTPSTNTQPSTSSEWPGELVDVNGLRYHLVSAPHARNGQSYVARYARAGREYTPQLEWVLAFASGGRVVPVMIPLG